MSNNSKNCYLCGKKVYSGTGTYYYGRLIHLKCKYIKKAKNEIKN
ncbi:MAG: hypothetical protein PHN56_03845 [Candidatus Nanoarchaeia archaeon]|nr:hypothetical protein [Candidatus Nanoarchaeia archaeon]